MRGVLVPILALGLSGCALFHSNVRGGFSCAAPRGTCAPSTTIDDAALQAIDRTREKDTAGSTDAGRSSKSSPAQRDRTGSDATSRHAALKVVYPSWRDGYGHAHKRAVDYVRVDAPGLTASADMATTASNAGHANLLAIAEAAPELSLLSPQAAPPGQDGSSIESSSASTSAAVTPLGTIQQQVRAILATAPKPSVKTTAPPAGSPAPSPVAPPATPSSMPFGSTFPPQGE